MTAYLLRYPDRSIRAIDSSQAISKGKRIRCLKPADDRVNGHDFTVSNEADYLWWQVTATETVTQEKPAGGFEDLTILDIERHYPDGPKPPFSYGG